MTEELSNEKIPVTMEVLKPELVGQLMGACMKASRIGIAHSNGSIIGIYAEIPLFSEIQKKTVMRMIKVDDNFDSMIEKYRFEL